MSIAEKTGSLMLFGGTSHGSTLAQAAALYFELERMRKLQSSSCTDPPLGACLKLNQATAYQMSYNGYPWTDSVGMDLNRKMLGNRSVLFGSIEKDWFGSWVMDMTNAVHVDSNGTLKCLE